MKTINFNDIDGKGKRQTHVVISDPINDKTYDKEAPWTLKFEDLGMSTEKAQVYTVALNGAISANLKPAEDVFSYSLISGSLDLGKPELGFNTLTITTGAKAQNWKLNLTLNNQSESPSAEDDMPDPYVGINAGMSKLNLGSSFEDFAGNKGVAFTANLTVNVSGKGGDEYYGNPTAIGIYSGSGIGVNGTMKGSVNVKNAQTMGGISFAYGFQTAGELVFAKDITGKITVNSDSKWMMAQAVAMEAASIDIAGDIKNAISVVANCPAGLMAVAHMFSTDMESESANFDSHIHIGGINAKLTATAKCSNPYAGENFSMAGSTTLLMSSDGDIVINGAVTKDVTATATSKAFSLSQTFSASSSVVFNGEVAGKISASATGGFISVSDIEKPDELEMFTNAQAILTGDKLLFRSNVTKDITATAKGEMLVFASAITADCAEATDANIKFLGTAKGKISANASVKKGVASATAIETSCSGAADMTVDGKHTQSGMIVFEKGIDNAVTATASGSQEALLKMVSQDGINSFMIINSSASTPEEKEKAQKYLDEHMEEWTYIDLSMKAVEASAFIADNDITVHDINGAITASATSKGGSVKAFAFEMDDVTTQVITITEDGPIVVADTRSAALNVDNVNKNITVTAKTSGVGGNAYAVAVGKTIDTTHSEHDLSNSPNLVLNGTIKGKITATATAKGRAYACGIYAENGIFGSASFSLGTINVTANGDKDSIAIGLRFSKLQMDQYATGGGTITGNLSVTCKNGEADGIIVESIDSNTFENKTLAMNIKVTGKNAYAVKLGKDKGTLDTGSMSAVALSGTVSATKADKNSGAAFAIKGGNATSDYVNILGGAKITGNIDLGTKENGGDTDLLYIHAGANIKGNISNAEEVWFVLDDASTAKKAMWQGDFDEDFLESKDAKLGISAYYGEEGTFTLFQTVETTSTHFATRKVDLRIDGEDVGTFTNKGEGLSCKFEDYDYTLSFKDGKKGGTVTLTIAKSSND